jgi:uncharacterized YigZ family protein
MNYRIFEATHAEQEIKKSRFICQMERIADEEGARVFIDQIRENHPKAAHYCFAYILGEQGDIQRLSDDGEPAGTAGFPMLDVLKERELTDLCAVVTRYFGGVKLGAGGLIRAYAGTVTKALEMATIVRLEEQEELQLRLDYHLYDSLQHFLSSKNVQQTDTQFSENITSTAFVSTDQLTNFLSALTERFSDKISIRKQGRHFVEVPIEK